MKEGQYLGSLFYQRICDFYAICTYKNRISRQHNAKQLFTKYVSVPRGIRTPIGGTGNHNSIH